MNETCSITPGTETQLPASGNQSAPPCSLLPQLNFVLAEILKLENQSRGPGRHEVFMGVMRSRVAISHAIHHEKLREANDQTVPQGAPKP